MDATWFASTVRKSAQKTAGENNLGGGYCGWYVVVKHLKLIHGFIVSISEMKPVSVFCLAASTLCSYLMGVRWNIFPLSTLLCCWSKYAKTVAFVSLLKFGG
ncbi:unnamed protein product [Choristocarpus tenellus]